MKTSAKRKRDYTKMGIHRPLPSWETHVDKLDYDENEAMLLIVNSPKPVHIMAIKKIFRNEGRKVLSFTRYAQLHLFSSISYTRKLRYLCHPDMKSECIFCKDKYRCIPPMPTLAVRSAYNQLLEAEGKPLDSSEVTKHQHTHQHLQFNYACHGYTKGWQYAVYFCIPRPGSCGDCELQAGCLAPPYPKAYRGFAPCL